MNSTMESQLSRMEDNTSTPTGERVEYNVRPETEGKRAATIVGSDEAKVAALRRG